METSSISTSPPSITGNLQARPQPQANEAQRLVEQQSSNKGEVGNIPPSPPPPKPTVNTDGQTVGTIVNVTA